MSSGSSATDCIFCAIVTGDAASTRVDEDDRTVSGADGVNLVNCCGSAAWHTPRSGSG